VKAGNPSPISQVEKEEGNRKLGGCPVGRKKGVGKSSTRVLLSLSKRVNKREAFGCKKKIGKLARRTSVTILVPNGKQTQAWRHTPSKGGRGEGDAFSPNSREKEEDEKGLERSTRGQYQSEKFSRRKLDEREVGGSLFCDHETSARSFEACQQTRVRSSGTSLMKDMWAVLVGTAKKSEKRMRVAEGVSNLDSGRRRTACRMEQGNDALKGGKRVGKTHFRSDEGEKKKI